MEKVWFYEQLFFKVVIAMVKNNKIRHKRYNVNQNQFHALHEMDKSIATRGFCQWRRHWHQHSNINIAF